MSVRLDTGRSDVPIDPPGYSAADPARFDVSLRRGTLFLSGNTASTSHETQLRETAANYFPDALLQTDFQPLGVAPGWWAVASIELIAALSTVRSPAAELRADRLRVRGLAADPSAAASHLQSLVSALPAPTAMDIRLQKIVTSATARDMCAREFAVFEVGPVNFEESGTEFRPSAYPNLDRVVALADACRDSTVTITGHTDSSGDETWNQQLSRARAETVSDYLSTMGIEPQRIIVEGAGSSVPIASNDTRFGRGLNRRIEIGFTLGQPE